MTDWIKLSHPKTGGKTRVPGDPHVVEHFAERGWEVDDGQDGPEVFIPARDPEPAPEPSAIGPESKTTGRRGGTSTKE